MLIPSDGSGKPPEHPSLSRRVNANSQQECYRRLKQYKLIKKGEC